MKVENQVQPSPENVQAFLAGEDAPVVMVNLLTFKEKASYADGRDTDLTGREAYQLYASEMRLLVEAAGGRFLYGGAVESLLLGEVEELWDMVGLVEYPTPKTLLEIASSPKFQEIEIHRVAGLAGQLNLAVRSSPLFD
ncbi:MAG: DUF1330 domain-containing protein [Proteobacteria bacterium]|nr:DUF1330 domain-containing protein [Pseudomonadota bacterium]